MTERELAESCIRFTQKVVEIVVAIEELTELAQAIAKDLRGFTDYANIIEKIEDVELEQVKQMYIPNQEAVGYLEKEKRKIKRRSRDAAENQKGRRNQPGKAD